MKIELPNTVDTDRSLNEVIVYLDKQNILFANNKINPTQSVDPSFLTKIERASINNLHTLVPEACNYNDHNLFMAMIKIKPSILNSIPLKFQTEAMCLESIEISYECLRYSKIRSDSIYDLAIHKDARAMQWVPSEKQTQARCIAAIENSSLNNISAFYYIQSKTPELSMLAIQKDWRNLQYINNPTEAMCVCAYEQDVRSLRILWPEVGFTRLFGNVRDVKFEENAPEDIVLRTIRQAREMEYQIYSHQQKIVQESTASNIVRPVSRKRPSIL